MKKNLTIVLLSFLIGTVVVAEEATGPLWIGIVRIDGLLVPIGTIPEGKRVNNWSITTISSGGKSDTNEPAWDADGRRISLQNVPDSWKGGNRVIPTKWYLWSEESQPKILKISHVEKFFSHCYEGWALKTDLHPTGTVDFSPTLKVGIAINRFLKIIPFAPIDKDAGIAAPFFQAIKVKFHELEKNTQYALQRNWEKGSIELSLLYRLKQEIDGSALYFLQAQRKYPRNTDGPDPDCYNMNSMNSWVALHGDSITFLSAEMHLSDCDGKGSYNVVPDLVLSLKGRYFIVSENYGYTDEFYTVHEILDGSLKEILHVDGGGC